MGSINLTSRQRRSKRKTLFERQNGKCGRCRRKITPENGKLYRLDRAVGPTLDNLQLYCPFCAEVCVQST